MLNSWGPTQSLLKNIQTMTEEELKCSIEYLERLDKSNNFNYPEIKLKTRIFELKEQLEFFKKC